MEVLISMGVILFGLLGVAALIPTGRFSVIEATKADRSANCGRAAIAEVKVRNLLDETGYIHPLGTPDPSLPTPWGNIATSYLPSLGSTYVIDPLGCAANPTVVNPARFPYGAQVGALLMYRVTLRTAPGPLFPKMDRLVADRIFTWRDDLIWDIDRDNPTRRTRQSFFCDDGSVTPLPQMPGEPAPPNALVPNADGNYSWMLTVTPSASDINSATPAASKRKFDVSVVVFFKRNLIFDPTAPKPTERVASFTFMGGGASGGDAILAIPDGTSNPTPEYLDVKENEWLMVTALVTDARVLGGSRRVANWYRVLSHDEAPQFNNSQPFPNQWKRRVTLAGPDWTTNPITPQTAPQAVLVDGVVGVYTKTIDLDRDSIWTK